MARFIRFTRADTRHAALGAIPAFVLVATGHLTVGVAFAIGLLPTSLLGIAPTRRLRVIYGIVGCLFGVGILLGSAINNLPTALTALLFIVISLIATILATRRKAGGLLLSIILPSLAVGTGYTVPRASALMLAFMAGSVWSCLVMLPLPEFKPDKQLVAKLMALQPRDAKSYGILLGLTVATAIVVGQGFHIPYAGWIATAAMLIMRPLKQMTGWRGVGRTISTIAGTLLVVLSINLNLSYLATAVAISLVIIATIGAKNSQLYVTPFGTAFLILTIELYGSNSALEIHNIGRYRIINNVLGALIALFYGLFVSWLLEKYSARNAEKNVIV